MISFSKLGQEGRLGNQLFQAASTIGIATQLNTKAVFPDWKYNKWFDVPLPQGPLLPSTVYEKEYPHHNFALDNHDVFGWLQTKKYWEHCEPLIRAQFSFRHEVKNKLKSLYTVLSSYTVAIHIRRGDYVNNSNYHSLPAEYYIKALSKYFKGLYRILVFSDDIEYAKKMLISIPNCLYISGLEDIEDMCLMSMCDNWIIANSSFSWWGAYLGSINGGKVVRPTHHFEGQQKKLNDISDLYPPEWKAFDYLNNI